MGRGDAVLRPPPHDFSEAETSLQTELLPAPAGLIAQLTDRCQVSVVSHAPLLIDGLLAAAAARGAGCSLTNHHGDAH